MKNLKILTLLVLCAASLLATACAVPTKGGRLYLFGEPQSVIVTNNTRLTGDLLENGRFLTTLQVGESYNVRLGFTLNSNKVLQFKAFAFSGSGQKIYQGMASQMFYVQAGTNNHQEWTISWIQRVQ